MTAILESSVQIIGGFEAGLAARCIFVQSYSSVDTQRAAGRRRDRPSTDTCQVLHTVRNDHAKKPQEYKAAGCGQSEVSSQCETILFVTPEKDKA